LIDPVTKYPLDESTSYNRYERPISSNYFDAQKEKEDLLKKYSDYNKPSSQPVKTDEEQRISARGGGFNRFDEQQIASKYGAAPSSYSEKFYQPAALTSPVPTKNEIFDNKPPEYDPPTRAFGQFEAPLSQRDQRILFSDDRKNDWRVRDDEFKREPAINRFIDYQRPNTGSYNKELISPLQNDYRNPSNYKPIIPPTGFSADTPHFNNQTDFKNASANAKKDADSSFAKSAYTRDHLE